MFFVHQEHTIPYKRLTETKEDSNFLSEQLNIQHRKQNLRKSNLRMLLCCYTAMYGNGVFLVYKITKNILIKKQRLPYNFYKFRQSTYECRAFLDNTSILTVSL